MEAIKYEHVGKVMKKKQIIKDVTLSIEQGEIFGLLGPNGAGKTTLMKMTVGLLSCGEGQIEIMGKNVEKDFCDAMREVGILIENPALYPHLSGYDNLALMAKMLSVPKEKITEVANLVGMEYALRQKTRTYSLGMKQRLGIAMTLLRDPKVVILDEPTNGLDPQGISDLRVYLKRIVKEKNITVMVSSHLLTEMGLLCDRFAIIKGGEIQKVMTKSESERMQGDGSVRFEVDQLDLAMKSLQGVCEAEILEDRVVVNTNRDGVAKVNKTLVDAGVQVYSITGTENTLESYYFNIINGVQQEGR